MKAQEKLKKAQELSRDDPLVRLWGLIISIHCGDQPHLSENPSAFGEFQEQAESLIALKYELEILKSSHLSPSSSEMTDFRRRYGRLRIELIKETYRRAIKR